MRNSRIHLEKITWDNYGKVLKLRVTKEQENYVASNKASLIHAFLELSSGIPVHAFAILNGKTVVSFMQLMYDTDWTAYEREDWLTSEDYKKHEGKPYYYIWRFMVDKKFQHRGYGREAFKQTLDFIKTFPDGKADYVLLSYEQTNEKGRELYASFGFEEVFREYLHDDDEVTAMLKL
ncbi:MAG: GNAT family N-acetyltransferase [Bacilli bacterium]|nr:GNAT family N-acetyltransferase [Bacilli bacterium]